MEKLEKVELIREKCGVSYGDAKAALDACGDDVLDAIVWLERAGKAHTQTASYTSAQASSAPQEPSAEMVRAQQAYEQSSARKTKFAQHLETFWGAFKNLCRQGLESTFVAERKHERVLAMPVLVLVILILFVWPATLPLLVVGLFFGFRYHFEGVGTVTLDVNDMMDKAADSAERIKQDLREE